jgi:cytochrome c
MRIRTRPLLGLLLTLWVIGTAAALPNEQSPTPSLTAVAPTPTLDRLAAPPTVPSPTQADEGAQLYWLWCQPCHGDQGQGLTDEWRAQYPEEDQNCWASGCHGARPYENGFTLPETVPPVTGETSLKRFNTLGDLYAYIRVAMPYEFPGTLSDEEYLAITAFLGRAHEAWNESPLDERNGYEMRLRPQEKLHTLQPIPVAIHRHTPSDPPTGLFTGVIASFITLGGIWLWHRSKH